MPSPSFDERPTDDFLSNVCTLFSFSHRRLRARRPSSVLASPRPRSCAESCESSAYALRCGQFTFAAGARTARCLTSVTRRRRCPPNAAASPSRAAGPHIYILKHRLGNPPPPPNTNARTHAHKQPHMRVSHEFSRTQQSEGPLASSSEADKETCSPIPASTASSILYLCLLNAAPNKYDS